MIGLKRGVVELRVNEKDWANIAKDTIDRLYRVMGDIAVDIQHVGSTSIKSIVAKPIIDLAVGVRDFDDVYDIIEKLEEAGFIHKEINDDEHQIYFSCGDYKADTRTHHIHVVIFGGDEYCNYIFFRDYLNEHPKVAREYETLKLDLLKKHKYDRSKYTQSKDEFIKSILKLRI